MSYNKGDLVWFDPEIGYYLPGQVIDYSMAAQVVTIEANIDGEVSQLTTINKADYKTPLTTLLFTILFSDSDFYN